MRAVARLFIFFWLLVPQLACYFPSEEMTPAEMDCCQKMMADCGGTSMQGHTCCPELGRPDVAIGPQTYREIAPVSQIATFQVADIAWIPTLDSSLATLAQKGIHSPPDDTFASTSILRI